MHADSWAAENADFRPADANAVSLFAGIGGFEEALRRAGIPTVASVELDDSARGVLVDHFPDTTLMTDVTEVTGDDLRRAGSVPEHGVLTAGWPCQGNSVAGRRGGMDDPRSGLWRHVVRLLAETRARWFIGENVPGLLSVNSGRDFLAVVRDLDDLGYGVAWRVLDAQYFGVPQRRRRVFVVGCLGDGAAPAQVLLEPESGDRDSAPRRAAGEAVAALTRSGLGGGGADDNNAQAGHLIASTLQVSHGSMLGAEGASGNHPVAYALRRDPGGTGQGHNTNYITHALTAEGADASEDGTGRGVPLTLAVGQDFSVGEDVAQTVRSANGQPGVVATTAVRRLIPLECERLQGFPDGWTATSNGRPQFDSSRYRQLGNAVAVPVVEWVARRVVKHWPAEVAS